MRMRMAWVLVVLSLACGRSEIVGDPPPVAVIDANPLTITARELVTLDGSRSLDPLREPLVYAWELVQKPPSGAARLETVNGARTALRPDRAGTWRVALVVTAGTRRSEAAVVAIEVREEVILPIANAGDDQRGFVGELFTLNGSQSRDPAGGSLSYEWSMSRPPGSTANLFGATGVWPTFIADRPGTYSLTLQVKARNQTDTDEMIVTVGEFNQAPIARIAPIPEGEVGRTTQLDGTGSSDPDLEPITYEWRATSSPTGGSVTLANATTATPSFVPLVAGFYAFELTVRDRGGLTGVDSRTMTVRAGDAGIPPRPDGGVDAGFDAGLPRDGGAGSDVFDPGEVYLAGTLQEGACYRDAIAHLSTPNVASAGFDCYFNERSAVIRPTDGRLVYSNVSDNKIRVFQCDNCPYTGTYASAPQTNDPVIPATCPNNVRAGSFLVSPEGDLFYSCAGAWFDTTGTQRFTTGTDTVFALGTGGWVITNTRVFNMRNNATSVLSGLPGGPFLSPLAVRWDGTDAFFVAFTNELWRVAVSTGTGTRVGTFPPYPPNHMAGGEARLDRSGRLYHEARDTSVSFRDAVVRCTVGLTCEVVYTEATNPLVKIHISSLVTGP